MLRYQHITYSRTVLLFFSTLSSNAQVPIENAHSKIRSKNVVVTRSHGTFANPAPDLEDDSDLGTSSVFDTELNE